MIDQEHKFFKIQLNNNLEELISYLDYKYVEMKEENWVNKEKFYDPGNHWLTFNIFNFDNKHIYNLQKILKQTTKDACNYYNIDFNDKKYYIHGWFNYYPIKLNNNVNPENLIYHDHGDRPDCFHGYYCVNAEPSITYYKINNKIFNNINKNNKAILSINGFPHAVGAWNENTNRITIAYNIVPFKELNFDHKESSQFIPL